MLTSQHQHHPLFFAIVRKKELKRQCNFEIIAVKQTAQHWFEVKNAKKGSEYIVRLNRKIATLSCTCYFGTQKIESGEIDEGHRCKHIQAVREFLNRRN